MIKSKLPEKIFPVEYGGFFDFNEQGVYDTSVINRDDYPNAEEIANEIAKRYNNFDKMKETILELTEIIRRANTENYISGKDFEKAMIAKQLLESIK